MFQLVAMQIIKCRDDTVPICFEGVAPSPKEERPFKLSESSSCGWAKRDESFGMETLRPRIEPWLTALIQSEHLSLLVGSG